MVTFGNSAHVMFYLDTYKKLPAVIGAFENIPWNIEESNMHAGRGFRGQSLFMGGVVDLETVTTGHNVATLLISMACNFAKCIKLCSSFGMSGGTLHWLSVGTWN